MKNILMILFVIPTLVLANGSETGHNNGNGHRDHGHEVPPPIVVEPIINQVVSNQIDSTVTGSNSSDITVSSTGGNANGGQGGSGGAGGSGGSATSSTGAVHVDASERNDYPASSAANVYAARCTTGMSGQTRSGGFGVTNSDQLCDLWTAAEAAFRAYEFEINRTCEPITCSVNCPVEGFVEAQLDACPASERANEQLALYYSNLAEAQLIIDATNTPALVDRVSGFLVRPGALLSLLIMVF